MSEVPLFSGCRSLWQLHLPQHCVTLTAAGGNASRWWQAIKVGWGSECDWGSEILHLEGLLWRWRWRRWWWSRWGSGVVRYFLWCAEWRGSSRLRVFGRSGLGRCRSAGAGWACRPAAASAASAPQSEPSGQSWHSPVSLTPAEEVGRRRIQLDYKNIRYFWWLKRHKDKKIGQEHTVFTEAKSCWKLPSAETLSSPSSCCDTWQQRSCSSPSFSSSFRAPEEKTETQTEMLC